MLDQRTLQKLATNELIKIYGRTYLQDNFENTCVIITKYDTILI